VGPDWGACKGLPPITRTHHAKLGERYTDLLEMSRQQGLLYRSRSDSDSISFTICRAVISHFNERGSCLLHVFASRHFLSILCRIPVVWN
jgi:hypothetical protein